MGIFNTVIYIAAAMIMLVATNNGGGSEGAIGMNWGRSNTQRLIPSTVVDLLLQNGIRPLRILSCDEDILKAVSGSGINLTATIVDPKMINSTAGADQWVERHAFYVSSANIRRIYIGNQPFGKGLNPSNQTYLNSAIDAYVMIQDALNRADFGYVKVAMPIPSVVLRLHNFTKPSEAEFELSIKEKMLSHIHMLEAYNAPYIIEFAPIYYSNMKKYDPSFAIPDGKSSIVIEDVNGPVYTNAFDLILDSFVWAMRKLGVRDLDIVVGAVGHPTDGFPGANASSAEQFYKHLLPYVTSNKGTPMRPGKPIDTFVHSLADENLNPYGGPFARHWGIYWSNGQPKYKIDLSGRGRDVFPTRAKAIMRMPKRWCVYREDAKNNRSAVVELFDEACKNADCTILAPGGSCSGLSFGQNVSYAFNNYFQTKFQDEIGGCSFRGYGEVVTEDPSTSTCVFKVEVVRGQQLNMVLSGQGLVCTILMMPGFVASSVSLFSIFLVLN